MKSVKRIIISLLLVFTLLANTACTSIIISKDREGSTNTKTTSVSNVIDTFVDVNSQSPVNTTEPMDDDSIELLAKNFVDYIYEVDDSVEYEVVDPMSVEERITEVYSYAIALIAYDISRNGYEVFKGTATTSTGETFIGLVFTDGTVTYDADGTEIPAAGFLQLADKTVNSYLTDDKVRNGTVAVVGEETFLVDRFASLEDFSGIVDGCYFKYTQSTQSSYLMSVSVENIDEDTEYDYSMDCYNFDEDRTAWKGEITRPSLTATSLYSEDAFYNRIVQSMNEMIKIQEENYYNNERSIFVAIDPAILDSLARGESLEAINGYLVSQLSSIELKENQFLVISATDGVQVFDVPDYDELVAQRKSNGWLQVLLAGGMLAGSIALACVTFGAATPAVITSIALVSGAVASVYAVSNLIEGIDNIRLANAGDVTTVANNPVRNLFIDTFGEDGTFIYNAVGITAMTIQSLIIPVNAGLKVASSVNAGVLKTTIIVGRAVVVNLLQAAVVGATSTLVTISVQNTVEKHTGNKIAADWSGLLAGFAAGIVTAGITAKLDQRYNFSGLSTKQSVVKQMQEIDRNDAIADMKPDKWANMSEEARKDAIERLVRMAAKEFDLDEVPKIRFFKEGKAADGSITNGNFSRRDGSIGINLYNMDDSLKIIRTVFHETTHAKQFQLLRSGVLNDSTTSLKNYITYDSDPAGYYNQPCEREAFMQGEWWKELARGIWYE